MKIDFSSKSLDISPIEAYTFIKDIPPCDEKYDWWDKYWKRYWPKYFQEYTPGNAKRIFKD